MTKILTTHVGSLPRPEDLIRTMFAKQEGVPVDPVALEQRTREAVAEVVAKQLECGVDVVSAAFRSTYTATSLGHAESSGAKRWRPRAAVRPSPRTSTDCGARASSTTTWGDVCSSPLAALHPTRSAAQAQTKGVRVV